MRLSRRSGSIRGDRRDIVRGSVRGGKGSATNLRVSTRILFTPNKTWEI
jgi:hypothetical protein